MCTTPLQEVWSDPDALPAGAARAGVDVAPLGRVLDADGAVELARRRRSQRQVPPWSPCAWVAGEVPTVAGLLAAARAGEKAGGQRGEDESPGARRERGVGRCTAARLAMGLMQVAAPAGWLGRVARERLDRAYGGPVAASDEVELEVDGQRIAVTSPGKVFFAERGDTKLDLVELLPQRRASRSMAAMGGRPVLLQRFPNGAGGTSFFQKRIPDSAPDWLETTIVSTPERHHVPRPRRRRPRPRRVGGEPRLPRASTSGPTSPPIRSTPTSCASISTRSPASPSSTSGRRPPRCARLLDELGIVGHPKTTGNRGLHVYVRLAPRWDAIQVRAAAVAVARELERRRPDLITAAWWKEERGTRVFVDFNQNAPHKTVFGAWSVRARPGGQVSTPLTWDEVDEVASRRADAGDGAGRGRGRSAIRGPRSPRAAVDRAAPRPVRARPGRRAAGRAVAARLPEDARRAAARGAEPGPQATGLTPGQSHRRAGDAAACP